MTDRQPLVPDGQPYGARKATVAAMRQAGVPLAPKKSKSPGTGGGPPLSNAAGPGGVRSGVDLLADHAPSDFPFLAAGGDPQETAAQPSTEPDSPLQALAGSAQSSFAAAVLSRLGR